MATSKQPVSASAQKKTGSEYGDLEDISVQPARNGYVVSERRAAKPTRGNQYPFREPEKYAFSSPEEVLVHIAKCLGVTRKEE